MNRMHSNNKGINHIHKNSSVEMMEHLSETASSPSDMDTTTLRDQDHTEYESLLCDTFGSQHPTVEDHNNNNYRDETTLAVVPSWNTIQTKLIDQVTQRFTPPVLSTTTMTNHSRFNDENMTTYAAATYNDDDDDYDSDNDAIHVLYYHHPPVSPPIMHVDPPHHDVTSSIVLSHDDSQHLMTHLVTTMMERYDLYHNMYLTDQIYDVRLYESVLILLLLSNQSHCNHNTDNNDINNFDPTTSTSAFDSYNEALNTVATFLVDPSIPCRSKLNVLQLLLVQTCRDHQPLPHDETGDELIPDEILRDMYAFCISLYFGVNDIEYTIHRCFGSLSDDDDDGDHSHNNASMTLSNADNFSSTTIATTGGTGSSQQLLCPMIWELRSKCLYLQEMYTIYDELSLIRPQPTQRSAVWSPLASPYDAGWESIKNYCYHHDSILIQDIDLLKAFYNILGRHKSMQYAMLIASIGYLRICMYHQEGVTMQNYFKYSEALQNVVLFVSNWMISDSWKMAVLYCLQYSIDDTVQARTKNDASTILSLNTFQQKKARDEYMYYAKVLSFCTCDDAYTDSFLVQSPQPGIDRNKNTSHTSSSLCAFYLLLWELRVLTCHHKQQRKERHQKLVQLLQHRILQFRSFLSKSASKISSNGSTSLSKTKQVMAQQLPVAANVMKTKMNQVRITIQTHVQICHRSFTPKNYRDK